MICPFRIDTLYNYSTINGTVVCTTKKRSLFAMHGA